MNEINDQQIVDTIQESTNQIEEPTNNLIEEPKNDLIKEASSVQMDAVDSNQSNVTNFYTQLKLDSNAKCLTKFDVENKDNFFKGCKWANDGSCLMTCSNDRTIKLFNLPSNLNSIPIDFDSSFQLNIDLNIKECGLIYDYCFNPTINSSDPSSCL